MGVFLSIRSITMGNFYVCICSFHMNGAPKAISSTLL